MGKKEAAVFDAALRIAKKRAHEVSATLAMGEAMRTQEYHDKKKSKVAKTANHALKWEKEASGAQEAEGKAEIAMTKSRLRLRSLIKGVRVWGVQLARLAREEYTAESALMDAKLGQKSGL